MKQYFDIYYDVKRVWNAEEDAIKYTMHSITVIDGYYLPPVYTIYSFDWLIKRVSNPGFTILYRTGYTKDDSNYISGYDPTNLFLHLNPSQFKREVSK